MTCTAEIPGALEELEDGLVVEVRGILTRYLDRGINEVTARCSGGWPGEVPPINKNRFNQCWLIETVFLFWLERK